jgi:hypothetical protein
MIKFKRKKNIKKNTNHYSKQPNINIEEYNKNKNN